MPTEVPNKECLRRSVVNRASNTTLGSPLCKKPGYAPVSLLHYPTAHFFFFLHHSKKLLPAIVTGLDILNRAILKLQNKYQLRACVINATINTLTE